MPSSDLPKPSSQSPPTSGAAQTAQTPSESGADALRASELQYRRLFETARDGILLLDSDQGKITDANPFMTELLGYSHDELIGKELWEIGLLQDKEASQGAFRQLKQKNYIRYEDLPLENRLGERRQVEFVSNLYRENGHTVIQCNIRDITERKRVAAELAAAADRHGRQAAELAVLAERTRMAQEIHDTLAQGFTGIITQMEAAEAALTKSLGAAFPDSLAAFQSQLVHSQAQLAKVHARIDQARDLARESLAEARRSVAALRSPILEAALLSEALAHFLTQSILGSAAKSLYTLEGNPYALPLPVEHCILRIGQAAIANAVEHAQAQEIVVTLSFDAGQVRLQVRDDGQGFDASLADTRRFGITGMRERAEKVVGTLSIVSRPGEGTDVSLTVPVSADAPMQEAFTE